MIFHDNTNIIQFNAKLCQQCGSCIAICPKNAIVYHRNPTSGILEINIDHDKCIQCGLCEKMCPANKHTELNDIKDFCKQKEYYIGHNTNDAIRKNASSGGVARTIIIEGLKKRFFDGVYTLKKTNKYPFAEGYFYTSNEIPNYDDIPNSVYHSIPLNLNMRTIQKCDRILIVGTTCQLIALQRYIKNKCKEVYSLCIFCKQQKSFESTKFIAKIAKVKINHFQDLKSFSYRGNGWPGYCSFNKKSIPWGIAAIMPFGRKLWSVPGCNICGNPFGTDADITLMDPWCIEDNNGTGNNLIVVHTEKGRALLQQIPNLYIQKKSLEQIEPALMYTDIIKKNNLIPYFRNECDKNTILYMKGKGVERQREQLQKWLTILPKMPFIIYRILNKLIKDKR